MSSLANTIRQQRKAAEISQEELVRELDIPDFSRMGLSLLENGKIPLSAELADKVLSAIHRITVRRMNEKHERTG